MALISRMNGQIGGIGNEGGNGTPLAMALFLPPDQFASPGAFLIITGFIVRSSYCFVGSNNFRKIIFSIFDLMK